MDALPNPSRVMATPVRADLDLSNGSNGICGHPVLKRRVRCYAPRAMPCILSRRVLGHNVAVHDLDRRARAGSPTPSMLDRIIRRRTALGLTEPAPTSPAGADPGRGRQRARPRQAAALSLRGRPRMRPDIGSAAALRRPPSGRGGRRDHRQGGPQAILRAVAGGHHRVPPDHATVPEWEQVATATLTGLRDGARGGCARRWRGLEERPAPRRCAPRRLLAAGPGRAAAGLDRTWGRCRSGTRDGPRQG